MALDPKKFAFLTTAIAASIVVVGVGAGCDDDIDQEGVGDGGISSSSSSGSTSSSSGSTSSSGGSSSGSTSSSSGSLTDGGSDAGACLGSEGAAPTCDDPGTACLADQDFMCGGYAEVFIPQVAKATIDCLRTAPTCEQGENYDAHSECAIDAVAQACPAANPTKAGDDCDDAVAAANCAAPADIAAAKAKCLVIYPALTETGIAGLVPCATNNECDFVNDCFDPTYSASDLTPQPIP